jgi:hypothetical protein
MVLFIVLISRQFVKNQLEWRANAILLLTQAATALGTYLLLDGFTPGERGTGFILSSLVTALTTYGIFTHTVHLERSHPQPDETEKILSSDLPFDPETNANALRE